MKKEQSNIFFLIGLPGVGKSFWGRKIATKFGLHWCDLDAEIVHKHQLSIEKIFERDGEATFRKMEADLLRFFVNTNQYRHFLFTTGGGTPCFHDNMAYMKHNGTTIWIDLPADLLVGRLSQNQDRPLVKHLSKSELRQYLDKTMAARLPFYEQAHHHLINPQKLEDFNIIFKHLPKS